MGSDPEVSEALGFTERAVERVATEIPHADLELFRLSFALSRAATRFVRHVESEVHRPAGLTWAGFRILFTLWVCGDLEAYRVAHLSGLSRASVSSAVNTLERENLVTRTPHEVDGRAIVLALTPPGRTATVEAYTAQQDVEKTVYGALTAEEQATLAQLIEKTLRPPQSAA
ncbi:MAG TPA: MarR family transcriptional regulator [Acidimicrobiia bacterium]|jgi:DNA-binding MarR family transcriptional regulator|nr:MarR family transcriptional regulator [Acidimicrobiia bacterium]HIL46938.1 MarR family transcriptional regulator [Acidimicrobiia bacterium]